MAGSNQYKSERLINNLGQKYKVLEVYFKPYPSCRWTHPMLEAVNNLCIQYK